MIPKKHLRLAALSILLLAPAPAVALDWDAARCEQFVNTPDEWSMYSEPEIGEIKQHCEQVLSGAGMAPPPEVIVETPVDQAAPPIEAPPPISLAEWDVARCDMFLQDPNSPAMYSPDDLNALYPHCQALVAAAAPPPADPVPVDPAIVEAPFDPSLPPEAAPPVLSLAEWDLARCDMFLQDPNSPAMYSPDDLNALYPHCQALVAAAAPPPTDPVPVDPAIVEAPFDPSLPPEATPSALSLAEWDVPRCEAFFADPNAASTVSSDDFNAIVPYCQSIMAVAIPAAADPALPEGDLLPPIDAPAIADGGGMLPPAIAEEDVQTFAGQWSAEQCAAFAADATRYERFPADTVAAIDGYCQSMGLPAAELLPDPGLLPTAEGNDLLLPPASADGALLPEPTIEAGIAPDAGAPSEAVVEGLPPVAMAGEPLVRIVITNATAAPLDVFVDPPAGGDPMFVATVEPEYSIVQPTNAGRTWRLVQNDTWLGSLVTDAEPQQFLRYEGQP